MLEMTQLWERLFLGGRIDAERLFKSNPFGITTVISLCDEEVLRRASSINYLHFPIADAGPLEVGLFDAILDAIAKNVRWGTVLLHCGIGASRAPILAAAWMDASGYKNIDGALREITRLRRIAPSDILLSSVRRHLR
jgi:protein-tyrosine phosphatase